ncbi:MAG: hypothetical protein ABSG43_14860 [Solirubrobacteraceae bacterium]|jgi:hypothetical protein
MTKHFTESFTELVTVVWTMIVLALFTPAVLVVAFAWLSVRGAL